MNNKNTMPRPAKAHPTNKAAKAEAELAEVLRPGQSVELLKELHILTREGRLNQDSRRKLKQVYHPVSYTHLTLPTICSV